MKKYPFAVMILLIAGLACQFNVDTGTPPAAQIASPTVVIPQAADTPAAPALFIQASGRSSLDISSELMPHLERQGWDELGIQESGIIVGAPQGLSENGLAYHITFNTNATRVLALVAVEMYFVPERIGTPFDEVYLFSGINRDAPALSVYQDVEGRHSTTFRGAYSFDTRLDVNDFISYMNFYAVSLDGLLVEYPFFSKQ